MMTTPGKYDLEIYRGDSFHWRFVLWQDAEKTEPLDLTGAVAKSEIRDKPGGTLVVPLACVVTEPNTIEVDLTPDESAKCPPMGAWDLQITYPDASVHTYVAGGVKTTADVTDSVPGARSR